MLKFFILFIHLLLFSALKAQPYQWIFNEKTKDSALLVGVKYNLLNTSINKSLVYQKHKKGINLGFKGGKNSSLNIVLKHLSETDTVRSCHEVAIFVENGAYLTYTEREYGITMGWSKEPVYEWRITTEDKACKTLKTGQKYGFFNIRTHKYLVFQVRSEPVVALDWLE
jgi:hypothetical protein